MATERNIFENVIRFLFDRKGAVDGKEEMKRLRAEAKRLGVTLKTDTTGSMRTLRAEAKRAGLEVGRMRHRFGDLTRRLVAFVGGIATFRFLRTAIGEAAKFRRSLGAIGQQLDRLGLDSDRNLPRIREFLTALEQSSGILANESTPAFQKFLGITKSVEGAMAALALVSDLTNAGLGDTSTNAERLANLLQGEVTEAAKSLGLQLRDQNGRIKSQTELLDELIDQYGGFSGSVDDAQAALDQTEGVIAGIRRQVGEFLAPAMVRVTGLFRFAVRGVKAFGIQLGGAVAIGISGFRDLGEAARIAFDLRRLFSNPKEVFDDLVDLGKQSLNRIKSIQAGVIADAAAVFRNSVASEAEIATGRAVLAEIAARKQREVEERERLKALEAARKLAEERAQFEQDIADRMLQARISSTEQGSKERLDLEIQMLRRLRDRTIEEARARGADVATVNALFRQSEEALVEEFDRRQEEKRVDDAERAAEFAMKIQQAIHDAEVEALEDGSEAKLELQLEALEREREQRIAAALQAGADVEAVNDLFDRRRSAARKKSNAERKKLAEEEANAKVRASLGAASSIIDAGVTLFGESKGLAVAGAIIDTYAAINGTLADTTLPHHARIAAAVAIGAQGFANVQKIRSTTLETGSSVGGAGSMTTTPPPIAPPAPAQIPRPTPAAPAAPASPVETVIFQGPTIIPDRHIGRLVRRARAEHRRRNRGSAVNGFRTGGVES